LKSTLHPDGLRRITMKIEVPVSVATMTVYALDTVRAEQDPVACLLAANKREIFALARASIQTGGTDSAVHRVQGIATPAQLAQLEQHIRQIFPEID
jgi:hypothetical protein